MKRLIELHFFAENKTFTLNVFTNKLNLDLYYCVLKMPESELISKNLEELGEELLSITTSAAWLATGKRRATCGDIIKYKDKYYGFVMNPSDPPMPNILLEEVHHMINIRQLVLVKLYEKEKVYGKL